MTVTIIDKILSSYGEDKTFNESIIAKKGFTAKTLKFTDNEVDTTSDAILLTGFTPADNSKTQILTLSRLSVDPNSGSSVDISIRPTDSFLHREKESGDPLEGLNDANVLNHARSEHTFTSTRLGVRDLKIGGKVEAYVDGGHHASANTGFGAPNTLNGTPSGTGAANNPMTEGSNYGHWIVKTEIQALTNNFESFTLLAGSDIPSDYVFLSVATGLPIKLSEMDLVDDNSMFLNDFVVDPNVHSIGRSFDSTGVKFNAGAEIPEGTKVFLTSYVAGSANLADGESAGLYPYGSYPKYVMKLSRGTVIESNFPVYDGYSLPGGQLIPKGSNVSDKPVSGDNLELVDIVASEGFELETGYELKGLIPTSRFISEPAGMTSKLFQPLIPGMSTDSDLDLVDLIIPPDVSLESEMELKTDFDVVQVIKAAFGSLFKKGSILYKGSKSIGGSLVNGHVTIPSKASIVDRVDISTSFVVDASTAGDNPLEDGTVLKGPFTLPKNLKLTSGNTLPAPLKVTTNMGATFKAGMEIAAGSVIGGSGFLYGNVEFSPTSTIPTLSTLFGEWNFPVGTEFTEGFNAIGSDFSIPVPSGFRFETDFTMREGTTFKEGGSIPSIPDIASQAGPAWGGDGSPEVGPLTKTVDGKYLIIKAHTTFMPGFKFPVGSVLSKVATAGHTNSYNAATTGTPDDSTNPDVATDLTYDLSPASYSLDESQNAPCHDEFTFTCGIATQSLVVMLSDTRLPYDLLIPLHDCESNIGNFISFNEKLTLISDIKLIEPYVVSGVNNVTWPGDAPLPATFKLSTPLSFDFASGSNITKAIKFNVHTSSDFIKNIMDASAYLKFPASSYTLDKPLKLGVNQPVHTSSTNSTKSWIQLAAGSKLLLENDTDGITLPSDMPVSGNFTVGNQIDEFPQFDLPNGIILLAGMRTPGVITIESGSPMPGNIDLTSEVTLAADATITDPDGYELISKSRLVTGSILSRESHFPNGSDMDNVTLSPIHSLSSKNIPFIGEGEMLTSSIRLPYLFDTDSKRVPLLRVDERAILADVASLKAQVAALEAALADE